MDKYIPSHNYIKNMRCTFEVPELQIYCEVGCIAEPLIELQSRQLWSLIQVEWMSRQWNQISLICVRRQQKLFCFFQLHTPVKLFFNDITTFKTKHGYQLQPEDDIRWSALKTTSPYFDKLVKQTQRLVKQTLYLWFVFSLSGDSLAYGIASFSGHFRMWW